MYSYGRFRLTKGLAAAKSFCSSLRERYVKVKKKKYGKRFGLFLAVLTLGISQIIMRSGVVRSNEKFVNQPKYV